MCGIFGLITKPESGFKAKSIKNTFEKIATISESRGLDSSGVAIRSSAHHSINIIKGDVPIRTLLDSPRYKNEINNNLYGIDENSGFCAFGHARLVTNGSQLNEANNQPVLKDDIIVIHNGIIINADELWNQHSNLNRQNKIDTEIIPSLIRNELSDLDDLAIACNNAFAKLQGTWSLALMFKDLSQFVLASNNGSLYYITDQNNFIVFSSEKWFLNQLKLNRSCSSLVSSNSANQIRPNSGLIVNLDSFKIDSFNTTKTKISHKKLPIKPFKLNKYILDNLTNKKEVVIDPSVFIKRSDEKHLFNLLENNFEAIRKLRRCAKCILPETFPFIQFNEEGICNYCKNYIKKNRPKTLNDLFKLVEPYRSKDGRPDCIVPFSGGRDSTYTLHIVKEILGLNPIAFTYDWGMVTDLARRNIARVCGKLGVENIIVSADINLKRENIKKNVIAWLKNPHLGMIPLFMSGDKYFFYYCNQVKKRYGIDLNIWGINDLENTDFKTGFAGLSPNFNKKRIYSLSILNQLKLFGFVGKNIFTNPAYVNQSVFDSLGSFAVRYIAPKRDYYHLFDFYRWNENEIEDLIKNVYNWESAIDTSSTWRIGDGTASFYNYIYYTVAGFTENDTFRSNQIRQGDISKKVCDGLIEAENFPRYETLRWYLEIIGLDFEDTINRVNRIPKLYSLL